MIDLPPAESVITPFDDIDQDQLENFIHRANQHAIERGGIPTWRHPDIALASLQTEIEYGHCFCIKRNGLIAATICISDSGKSMWPDEDRVSALYFSKLIKNPDIAMPGDVKRLLNFLAQTALDQDKQLVRCDVNEDMDGLRNYYEKNGFSLQGTADYGNVARRGALYQIASEQLLRQTSPIVEQP